MKKILLMLCLALIIPASLPARIVTPWIASGKELSLPEALELVLKQNPRLAIFDYELRAADARKLQAGLWPNPSLSLESEEFAGDKSGFSDSENTIQLNQPIVLGGKIRLNKEIAGRALEVVQWEYEAAKQEILTEAKQAFYKVLRAQEKLKLAQKTTDIAQSLLRVAEDKLQAGAIPPLEVIKAKVEASRSRLALMSANKGLEAERKGLASFWGAEMADFGSCRGKLKLEFSLPAIAELRQLVIKNHPLFKGLETSRTKRNLELSRARVEWIPDIELGFGARRLNGEDVDTFVAGISIPLPLFNRNQGGVREALVNLEKVDQERLYLENRLLRQLNEIYPTLESLQQQVTTFQQTILFNAQEALDIAMEGYKLGKFGYLHVLDAQKTQAQVRDDYLERLTQLRLAVAELEGLIVQPLTGNKEIMQ